MRKEPPRITTEDLLAAVRKPLAGGRTILASRSTTMPPQRRSLPPPRAVRWTVP